MAIASADGEAVAVRGLLRGDDAVETGARESKDQRARNNAERGRGDERRQPHARESRHQIDQEEGKGRHQPQEQKIIEGVLPEALRKLRGVDVGVFQVTSPNSTEVSDYGVYDTSTLGKDVTAVVNVTFSLS
jgi:hypothetical protein